MSGAVLVKLHASLGVSAETPKAEVVERALVLLRTLGVSRSCGDEVVSRLLEHVNDGSDDDVSVDDLEILSRAECARRALHRARLGAGR